MVNYSKIQILLFLFLPILLVAGKPKEVAQHVLDRLYAVHGQFNPNKPKLEIISAQQNVARYLKYKNTIQLEETAYNLCRSFGKDSLDALAFILAHEMIHAIQVNNVLPNTSFISYDMSLNSSLEIEQDADIQGIFASYLAGFKTQHLIPQIIDKMYEVYQLKGKVIKGYPSEQERKQSYKKVAAQANELIELFHLANEMSLIEEFQAAIQCLEYITRFYQGKEIYNNLGINYTLMALNHSGKNLESYIYPIELDWNIRIKKPKTGRGDDELNPIAKIEQMQFLHKAKEYFSLASSLDRNYTLAEVNLFCVLIIQNDLHNAHAFYLNRLRQYSRKSKHVELYLKIKSANAILLAKSGNTVEAKRIWTDLSKSTDSIIAGQAEQNISQINLNKYVYTAAAEPTCKGIDLSQFQESTIKLRNIEPDRWVELDSMNGIDKKLLQHSTVYSSIVKNHRKLSVQKIYATSKIKFNDNRIHLFSLGNNQWIYLCKKEKIALILNDQFETLYLLRYYPFSDIY